MDFAELDSRALTVCEAVVGRVDPDRLDVATPCAAWNLGTLLAHMVGQNRGFAAAALGETQDRRVFDPVPVGAEPARRFAESAAEVHRAFTAATAADRPFWLPEVRDPGLIPAATAMSFHFVDSVAHAWDVAASIGATVEFDADLLDAALAVAERVPDGPNRDVEGAAFRRSVAAPADAPILDRVLARLGRSPNWQPA